MWICIRELQVLNFVSTAFLCLMLHFHNSNVKFKAQKY
jgi:hypothetical protein